MPSQTRDFSSKKIDADKNNIPKKRRATTMTRRKPIVRKKKTSNDKKEMDNFLNDIYDNRENSSKMDKIEMRKKHPILKFFFTFAVIGAFFAGVAWLGFFTFPGNKNFSEESVGLTITGPQNVNLGATTTYQINYTNLQKVDLTKVVLTVKYPEGFELLTTNPPTQSGTQNEWDLGTLNLKEKGSIEIVGKMYGSLKQEQSLRAFLNYTPENFESELQTVATLSNKIDKTPFELSIIGPDSAVVGNDVEYKFILETKEMFLGQDLELVPQLPENFYITNSKPKLETDNKWIVLNKNATSTETKQEFILTGKYSEIEADKITAGAELQLYTNTDQTYTIAKSEITSLLSRNDLGFNLAINGSIKDFSTVPDELLTISLRIKNSNDEDFSDAKIKLWLDAPATNRESLLDWAKISDEADGDIQGIQLTDNERRGQIVWTKRDVPALEKIKSGEEVVLDLSLPIKNSTEINLSKLKSYLINVASEISFTKENAEKTISSNPINITVNSDLTFETRDNITKEGDKETHNITWVINNHLHPLKNIKLTADVYGDVEFITTEDAIDGELKYDQNNKKITWIINQMPVEVDVFALPFGIKLNTKNLSQETLISKVHIEATDDTTGETISLLGEETKL